MAGPRGVKTTFISSDLQRIRQMLKDGVSQGEIARAFNVHPSTISRLVDKHDLHDAASPLNPLQAYLAREKKISAMHEEANKAYNNYDFDTVARIEDEITALRAG